MSTLCRAEREMADGQGNGSQELFPPDSPAHHSSGIFSCPIHLSAFQKYRFDGVRNISDNRKYFGKTALSRNYFGFISLQTACQIGLALPQPRKPLAAKAGQARSNRVKPIWGKAKR
jgi:hypothetical protein